jgi:hypothetical protein
LSVLEYGFSPALDGLILFRLSQNTYSSASSIRKFWGGLSSVKTRIKEGAFECYGAKKGYTAKKTRNFPDHTWWIMGSDS